MTAPGVADEDLDGDVAAELPETDPEHYYPDVAEFVVDFLAPTYAREWHKMDAWRWCSSWWLHTEAVVRLEAMWRAWEVLRLDSGLGASSWLLHHGDPGIAALTAEHGTFARCHPGHHEAFAPLPVEEPPPGMFTATSPAAVRAP